MSKITLALSLSYVLLGAIEPPKQDSQKCPAAITIHSEFSITILHTNDTHSRIEPFESTASRFMAGKGGVARRATLIKQIRNERKNVLLLDAGDSVQGTPFFNRFKGTIEYKLMSLMGYDAGTLGNHDFDNGVDALVAALKDAKFPLVNCNYDFSGAITLQPFVNNYLVKVMEGGLKVGITGVGPAFHGLVTPGNHKGITWIPPVEALKPVVKHLREVEKVHLVVLISHMGTELKSDAIDDMRIAERVPGIDIIIGGHTHEAYEKPLYVKKEGYETYLFQAGYGGIFLGRIDLVLGQKKSVACNGARIPITSHIQ